MSNAKTHAFSIRAFVSVSTTLFFALLVVTGVVLFITPPGRVANWTGWRLLALSKAQWGALHIWSSVSFLVVASFHIWLNWKSLLSYFKSKLTRQFSLRREWAAAGVFGGAIFAGTLAEVPPFSQLMVLNESIKESWEEEDARAPIPHAELLSLAELARETEVTLDEMVGRLKRRGISVASADVTVGTLADEQDLTPNELYEVAAGGGARAKSPGSVTGRGIGQQTLAEFCASEGLDSTASLQQLREAGISAEVTMTLHDIAQRSNQRPWDLLEILKAHP